MEDLEIRLLLSGIVLGFSLFVFTWSPDLDGYHRHDLRWGLRASSLVLALVSTLLYVTRP